MCMFKVNLEQVVLSAGRIIEDHPQTIVCAITDLMEDGSKVRIGTVVLPLQLARDGQAVGPYRRG